MAVLKKSLARHPGDRDTLLALISFSRDAGDFATALHYAEQLARVAPNDPSSHSAHRQSPASNQETRCPTVLADDEMVVHGDAERARKSIFGSGGIAAAVVER